MKIKDSIWFTGEFGTIGIVIVEEPYGATKAYIGLGKGKHERNDALAIALYGVPVYPVLLKKILGWLEPEIKGGRNGKNCKNGKR
jgi:hypothetical protein